MVLGRKNSSEPEEVVPAGDGAGTLRLREAEDAAAVSRRGVLWRAGLATAGGIGALTLLDAQRADATTGTFTTGTNNNSDATTTLTATADLQPLLKLDGSPMGATDTTLLVEGPSNGGTALRVHQGAGLAGTVGLAISVGADGGSSGIGASSGSATAISGSSTSGVGVAASSTSGTALKVTGKAHFSRSGVGTVAQGSKTKTLSVSGVKATSLVLVTLQTSISGIYLAAAVPGSGKFTVHLNKSTPAAAKFAWFVLN